jgi:thioredoxin-dependent peroxiredoxin
MPIRQAGAKAPDFTVLTDEGREVSLSDYKGQNVVLYFYPVEGCRF